MSVNQKNKIRKNTTDNANPIKHTEKQIFLNNINKEKDNKRYSNSLNKDILYIKREDDIEKLNNIYNSKDKEYNILLNQYKEILILLNKKKEYLNQSKSKYQNLLINNNNMKIILLKLMKIKGTKEE